MEADGAAAREAGAEQQQSRTPSTRQRVADLFARSRKARRRGRSSATVPVDELLVTGSGHKSLQPQIAPARHRPPQAPALRGVRADEWRGSPLSLALHHRNGDRHDNRLPNLQLSVPTVTARPITSPEATEARRRLISPRRVLAPAGAFLGPSLKPSRSTADSS